MAAAWQDNSFRDGKVDINEDFPENGPTNGASIQDVDLLDEEDDRKPLASPGRSPNKAIEDDKSRSRSRKPFHYPTNRRTSEELDSHSTLATYNRYRYYSRLAPPDDHRMRIPDHIVPATLFYPPMFVDQSGKQGSLITIFSIWNTMMGTSLLSMPWALGQAGFVLGLVIMVVMAGLTLYTCYRVIKSVEGVDQEGEVLEFSDVCRHYLGRWGEGCSVFFSLSALLGAMIVYWVLMTNFLYNVVSFAYENINAPGNETSASTEVLCPLNSSHTPDNGNLSGMFHVATPGDDDTFHHVWERVKTVPFFLVILVFPLLNFKSPTFFTKFNALGTMSVVYLVVFVSVKASQWGIHLDFSHTGKDVDVTAISKYFPALTGTLCLAYFIHNCVLSITRNVQNPKNTGRDLTIAYICVMVTYVIVGAVFYASFPKDKDCIEDNLLNNFSNTDTLAFVARVFLLFQMWTVFPLLFYIFRLQFMHTLFGSTYPSLVHVIVLNLVLVGVCVIFARFLPHIGTIIRFSGAFCGLAYIFTLPCLVHLVRLKQAGRLTWPTGVVHGFIILLGLANFVGQFFFLNKT
ncbi:neutral amino acid transporter 9-like isoform X2 [Branchiostoma lanceolatum]|uniref:neutral amino acid transporter 9-like isoform X2 n=1 Tax=Branchiostoma lanceolatum TaxID=7740 RepID=UPI003453D42F